MAPAPGPVDGGRCQNKQAQIDFTSSLSGMGVDRLSYGEKNETSLTMATLPLTFLTYA